MELVELARLRGWSIWYTVIVIAIAVLIALFGVQQGVTVDGKALSPAHVGPISASALAPLVMFFALVYATSAGLSLNRDNDSFDVTRTKPIPRWLIALRFVAVDILAVFAAYGLAFALTIAVATALGFHVTSDAISAGTIVLSLGIPLMWYALIQALTAGFGGRARMVAGLLWPVALTLGSFDDVRGAIGSIARAINVLNPLAYLNGATIHGQSPVQLHAYWDLSLPARAGVVWLLALALVAVAIAVWSRREA